jgi:hypothetical protein
VASEIPTWPGGSYDVGVRRVLTLVPLVVSVLALGIAVAALHEAGQPSPTPSVAEIQAAGVREFTAAGNRMTPTEVLQLLGKPTAVYRNNPNALCWRYDAPYEIRMCWGPKRKQAWIATNIPPDRA